MLKFNAFLTDTELRQRLKSYFLVPFWIALIASLLSLVTGAPFAQSLVQAISELLPPTLLLLLTYTAAFMLMFSITIERVPLIAGPIRRYAILTAGVAMDFWSGAAGVIWGTWPALMLSDQSIVNVWKAVLVPPSMVAMIYIAYWYAHPRPSEHFWRGLTYRDLYAIAVVISSIYFIAKWPSPPFPG